MEETTNSDSGRGMHVTVLHVKRRRREFGPFSQYGLRGENFMSICQGIVRGAFIMLYISTLVQPNVQKECVKN